jgi:hypothetical protein
MPVDKYTIIVSGEHFSFTLDQLESDPGNFFASYFTGGFKEVPYGTREMEIEKEPLLFRLIQAHLRGYDILPLADQFVPPYMTKEGALNNLLKEATFYGLWNLQTKIQEYQKTTKANTAKAKALERLPQRKYKLAVSLNHSTEPSIPLTVHFSDRIELAIQTIRMGNVRPCRERLQSTLAAVPLFLGISTDGSHEFTMRWLCTRCVLEGRSE